MAKALLFVFTNPASAEEEAEYNEWYEAIHLGELLEYVPGIIAASRYTVQDLSRRSAPGFTEGDADVPLFPQRYAAIYEIEADDPEAVVRSIRVKSAEGRFRMSPALDRSATPPAMVLLTPTGSTTSVGHPAVDAIRSA